MAIQWHPLLAQFLRHYLSNRIQIQDSVPLGEMPIEMDLLFQPIVPIASLPYPYNHLGGRTIGEFKGVGDDANWSTVAQIESYACQYQMREKIEDRSEITLWIIASKFAESFFRYIEDFTPVGDGVQCGTLAQFPIYQLDLATLPISLEIFPLLMVYRGDIEREKEIMRFFIENYEALSELSFFMETLHPQALKEVLATMNVESLRGFDLDMPAIIDLFGTERVLRFIGQNNLPAIVDLFGTEVLQTIGTEEVLQAIGRENALQNILASLTDKDLASLSDEDKEKLIAQIRQSQQNGGETEK
jgi:hypothetical protein